MFIIGLALYACLTVVGFSALVVYLYMLGVNAKYKGVYKVFEVEDKMTAPIIISMLAIYVFLSAFLLGDLGAVWTQPLFLLSLLVALVASFVICGIMRLNVRDKVRYAETFLADEIVLEKIDKIKMQIANTQARMTGMSSVSDEYIAATKSIKEYKEVLSELNQYHVQLDKQKVLINADLSEKEFKSISRLTTSAAKEKIMYQKDRLTTASSADSSMYGVRELMKKYN